MRHTLPVVLLLIALPASADEPVPAPAATSAPAADALPSVRDQARPGLCENPPVKSSAKTPAGADQYFWGEWTIADDGTVTGFEERLLFANAAWKATKGRDGKAGEDCVVRWNVTGTVAEPEGCEDCNLAIHFEANVDYEASTCPQQLVVEENHYRSAYDFKKKPDGTLEVYFSNSGNPFGTGNHRGSKLNYLSKHRCAWL